MNDEEDCNVWFSEGLQAISKGLVAVLLLAGNIVSNSLKLHSINKVDKVLD